MHHGSVDRKDREIQYLHKKLQEYEDTIEDLQTQLDEEVKRRRQEKEMADAAIVSLEQQLKLRDEELQNVLSSTIQNRRQQASFNEKATVQMTDLKREVDHLRRVLQTTQQELTFWQTEARSQRDVPQPESLFDEEDVGELCRILTEYMGCDEALLNGDPRVMLRALEMRAVVSQESLKCLTTFIAELGQLVWEEAGDIDGLPNYNSNFAMDLQALVTQKASVDLHHQLKYLMLRCEDVFSARFGAPKAPPPRAELVKAVYSAYRAAGNCQKQVKAMVRRCHVNSSYGRFPKEHQENLKTVEQMASSFLERLQYAVDHCLTPAEREAVRSTHLSRASSPPRSPRGESPERRDFDNTVHSRPNGRISRATRRPPERYAAVNAWDPTVV